MSLLTVQFFLSPDSPPTPTDHAVQPSCHVTAQQQQLRDDPGAQEPRADDRHMHRLLHPESGAPRRGPAKGP